MSVPALAARAPACVAAPSTGTAPGGAGAGGAAQGDGENLFATLLAGLGDAAQPALAGEEAPALAAALPTDAAPVPGDGAALAAAPDPLAGMALLMAQYCGVAPAVTAPPSAPATGPFAATLPAGGPSSAPAAATASASPALPAAVATASSTASLPIAQGQDLFNTSAPAGPDPAQPSVMAPLPALAADAAPVLTATQAQAALQALPDMGSFTAGWATAPTPGAAQGPGATAPVYQAELPSRPGDAAFAGDLAAQVTVLVEGGFQQAELRLNPAELGPIQIHLNVSTQTQTADISFSAVHGLTRESIEQALPELRDMLEAQGLSLGQTGVSGGQQQGGDGRDSAAAQARAARAGAAPGGDGTPVPTGLAGQGGPAGAARATRGMLDLYA